MLSKSFFGSSKPVFKYELLSEKISQPIPVKVLKNVTLLMPGERPLLPSATIKIGAAVLTGQKLCWKGDSGPSVVSTVTGKIKEISNYLGDYGRKFTAITIEMDSEDQWDEQFAEVAKSPSLQMVIDYLSGVPGAPPLASLADEANPLHTIVVYGGDTDLLVETNVHTLKSHISTVNKGIKVLKQVSGVTNVIIAVTGESLQNIDGHFEADIKNVGSVYPSGQPLMICHQLFKRMPQQGQRFENLGIYFIRAEAVAAIGQAITTGRIPVEKTVTILDKKGQRQLVTARIGTPIGTILKTLGISVNDGDRVIFGGPMTGSAAYSEDQPITPETDAVMVQDATDIIRSSDYPCINCGECVRTCPANIQVNMLERFLEVGKYQEGADLYDLYSCVECGLCSYVCAARIPILQYIKLAKYELERAIPAEEVNE